MLIRLFNFLEFTMFILDGLRYTPSINNSSPECNFKAHQHDSLKEKSLSTLHSWKDRPLIYLYTTPQLLMSTLLDSNSHPFSCNFLGNVFLESTFFGNICQHESTFFGNISVNMTLPGWYLLISISSSFFLFNMLYHSLCRK